MNVSQKRAGDLQKDLDAANTLLTNRDDRIRTMRASQVQLLAQMKSAKPKVDSSKVKELEAALKEAKKKLTAEKGPLCVFPTCNICKISAHSLQ